MSERAQENRVQKEMRRCVHFNGILSRKCEAGVCYEEKAGGAPALKKLPCLLDHQEPERAIECEHALYLTPKEAEAEIEEGGRHIREYLSKIAEGLCPHCATQYWRQVGRCVYCNGCGARLYQGALPAVKRDASSEPEEPEALW